MIPASFPFPFNHRAWVTLHPHPHPRQRRHSSFSLPILASLLITLNPSTEHRRTATCLSAVAPRVYCCRFSRGPVCCLPAPACLFRSLSIPSFCKRREGSGLASRCISATMHVGDHVTSRTFPLLCSWPQTRFILRARNPEGPYRICLSLSRSLTPNLGLLMPDRWHLKRQRRHETQAPKPFPPLFADTIRWR